MSSSTERSWLPTLLMNVIMRQQFSSFWNIDKNITYSESFILKSFCLHLQPVCRTCKSKQKITTTKSQRELLSHFYVLFYFSHDVKLIIYAPFMLFMLLFWCIFVLHLVHVVPLSSSFFLHFHTSVCFFLCV